MSLDDTSLRRKLALALDVDTAADALRLVDRTEASVGVYKIGLQLFVQEGPGLVRDLVGRGREVFLDLKLHDIPNTILAAARRAAELGVGYLTVHCANGPTGLAHLVAGLEADCQGRNATPPRVLGVTVLTSLTDAELHSIGVERDAPRQVELLAGHAWRAGVRSFVASAQEAAALRQLLPECFLVTPGIRSPGEATGDQARVMTPAQAILAGSDMLVIGRPITRAADPGAAAAAILADIRQAAATLPVRLPPPLGSS